MYIAFKFHESTAHKLFKYENTYNHFQDWLSLSWDEQKSILVASLDDGAFDHLKTFLNESMLLYFIGLQLFTQQQNTVYIILRNMYQLPFSLCWARTLLHKAWWCC